MVGWHSRDHDQDSIFMSRGHDGGGSQDGRSVWNLLGIASTPYLFAGVEVLCD